MPKKPTINITDLVMQRIEKERIMPRPRPEFWLKKFMAVFLFASTILGGGFMFLALDYAVRYDIFREYLSLTNGTRLFINSLPWAGISSFVMSILASLGAMKILRNIQPNFKFAQAYASLAVFAFMVTVLGGVGSAQTTPKAFAFINYFSSADPIKIDGTISSVGNGTITVSTADGMTKTLVVDGNLPDIKAGDQILLLGFLKENSFKLKAAEVTYLAPPEEEPKKPAPKKETKPKDEPVTTPTTTTTTKTTTEETVKDPEPTPKITIQAVGSPIGAAPDRKYQIDWSANYKLPEGYKLIWALKPTTPTWPTSHYKYDSTPSISGTTYVRETLGAGTYYVRLCQYRSSDSKCVLYSNMIEVTFP